MTQMLKSENKDFITVIRNVFKDLKFKTMIRIKILGEI